MLPFVALTVLATAGLLAADYRHLQAGVWVAKPLASLGFVATALAAGALASPYGAWVLVALVLCLLGDVLLIPHGAGRVFQAGVGAFLLGHVAFAVAFCLHGVALPAAAGAALVVAPTLAGIRYWLGPHLPPELRTSVTAYVVVIGTMVVCAIGAAAAGAPVVAAVGAVLFAASDVSVARDRFVGAGFSNRLWGLPLYFGATLLLAASVATAAGG